MASSKEYIIDGEKVELYSIGELSERLGRQNQTIRLWERKGKIPEATYRSPTGARLYSEEQIEAIVSTVKKYDIRQGTKITQDFIDDVFYKFREATRKTEEGG